MNAAAAKPILIVDDAALVRSFYRAALERHGYRVEEALNGLEGLEKLLLQPFDLVILDINMPQMDGITFLRTLRSRDLPMCSVPVLVTSTEAGPHDIVAARAAGANYYLVKPISRDMLAEYVAMLCGVRR